MQMRKQRIQVYIHGLKYAGHGRVRGEWAYFEYNEKWLESRLHSHRGVDIIYWLGREGQMQQDWDEGHDQQAFES